MDPYHQLFYPTADPLQLTLQLTGRELEIAAICGSLGLTTREMAGVLGVSEYTVRCHYNSIYRKLQPLEVICKPQLVIWCWRLPDWARMDEMVQGRFGPFKAHCRSEPHPVPVRRRRIPRST